MHQRVQLFVPDKKYYTESIFLRVVLPVRLDGMDERVRGVFRNTILRRRDTFSEIYTSPGWTLPAPTWEIQCVGVLNSVNMHRFSVVT